MKNLFHSIVVGVVGGAMGVVLCSQLAAPAIGRVDAPPAAAGEQIAICDVIALMNQVIKSDRYEPARKAMYDAMVDADKPRAAELRTIYDKLRELKPESEEYATAYQEYRKKVREVEDARDAETEKYHTATRAAAAEAFGLVRDAAVGIAKQKGYRFLLQASDPNGKFDSEDSSDEEFKLDVQSRTALLHPAEVDITEDVRADLHIK